MLTVPLDVHVRLGALRWLHALDLDSTSLTYGIADREYWSWKTKDFPNGTWQGGLSGFLDAAPLLPLDRSERRAIAHAAVVGSARIQRSDGSFEEAYPLESSFAVTGLVAFDLLYALLRHPDEFDDASRGQLHEVAARALGFLERTPETHGHISNHLATSWLALWLGEHVLGRDLKAARLLDDLVASQHPTEGWFPEYGGADPGYQTLLGHYFAAAHGLRPLAPMWLASMERSQRFTANFTFPDGSFSGEVGGRGTSIFYPGGAVPFGVATPAARHLASWFLLRHLGSMEVVGPTNVDPGNFVPVFNAWAFLWRETTRGGLLAQVAAAPMLEPVADGDVDLRGAGLVVIRRPEVFAVFSTANGALRRCLRQQDGTWRDDTLVGLATGPRGASTQLAPVESWKLSASTLEYELVAARRKQPLNSAVRASALRVVAWVIFVAPFLQRTLKRALAAFVMGRSRPAGVVARVRARLVADGRDEIIEVSGRDFVPRRFGFHRHMASANTFARRAL
jgi:hypothetical protein